MKNLCKLIVVSACVGALSPAFADGGNGTANMYYCVQQNTPAQSEQTYTFTSSNEHCMFSPANAKAITVTVPSGQSGFYCSDKFVFAHQKNWSGGGNLCLTDGHIFTVSMASSDKYAAGADTDWGWTWAGGAFGELSNAPHMSLCSSKSDCKATKASWAYNATPDLYMVYNPADSKA